MAWCSSVTLLATKHSTVQMKQTDPDKKKMYLLLILSQWNKKSVMEHFFLLKLKTNQLLAFLHTILISTTSLFISWICREKRSSQNVVFELHEYITNVLYNQKFHKFFFSCTPSEFLLIKITYFNTL